MQYLPNELQLVIAGDHDTDYGRKMIKHADELGLQKRIHFLGKIPEDEKQWLYEHCEVFCFPSLLEGFGLPIIEAQYLGVKSIVSKETSIPEVAGPGSEYFSGFDPKVMAKEILNLIDKDFDETLMKKNVARFSWENAAAKYFELYCELMESK